MKKPWKLSANTNHSWFSSSLCLIYVFPRTTPPAIIATWEAKYWKYLQLKRFPLPLLLHRELGICKSFVATQNFVEREVTPNQRTKETLWKETELSTHGQRAAFRFDFSGHLHTSVGGNAKGRGRCSIMLGFTSLVGDFKGGKPAWREVGETLVPVATKVWPWWRRTPRKSMDSPQASAELHVTGPKASDMESGIEETSSQKGCLRC